MLHELSHPFANGMPHYAMVPPFQHLFQRRLGDVVRPGGLSIASDLLIAPLHVGTHIDAFSHVADAQALDHSRPSGEHLPPLLTRAVLLDCRDAVEQGILEIGPEQLDAAAEKAGVVPAAGDVALVATGWERHWDDPEAYAGRRANPPGLSVDGARRLADAGVVAVGADTSALEPASTQFGVHRLLLEERRVHIIENLRFASLLDAPEREMLFLGLPLRIVGATASPLRCIALTGEDLAGLLVAVGTAVR